MDMSEKRQKASTIYKNALIKMKKSDAVKEVAKKMKVTVPTARRYLSEQKTLAEHKFKKEQEIRQKRKKLSNEVQNYRDSLWSGQLDRKQRIDGKAKLSILRKEISDLRAEI